MLIQKYNCEIDDASIKVNLKRIINQIYKLLPYREEESDWETPLTTVQEELSGMSILLEDHHDILFPLLCKLEGLFELKGDSDFFLYRRTIFECLTLANRLMIE